MCLGRVWRLAAGAENCGRCGRKPGPRRLGAFYPGRTRGLDGGSASTLAGVGAAPPCCAALECSPALGESNWQRHCEGCIGVCPQHGPGGVRVGGGSSSWSGWTAGSCVAGGHPCKPEPWRASRLCNSALKRSFRRRPPPLFMLSILSNLFFSIHLPSSLSDWFH